MSDLVERLRKRGSELYARRYSWRDPLTGDIFDYQTDALLHMGAVAELDRLTARVAELERALDEFVDWDGQTWRITSTHPNDRSWQDDWKALIARARAALAPEEN